MFVGVGASRVRDLFDQAKKNSPCIIFIDEIDAVGRQRGAGLGGGHDEREQTLNQLLVEMDGFGANEGVIMIAATNRAGYSGPGSDASRPFRPPGDGGLSGCERPRGDSAKYTQRASRLHRMWTLHTIAKSTAGFTGADLENLLNEAALLAARKDHKAITMEEIEEATIKVVVGTEKKSRVMTEQGEEADRVSRGRPCHCARTSAIRRIRCTRFPSFRAAWQAAIRCTCRRRTSRYQSRNEMQRGARRAAGRPCGGSLGAWTIFPRALRTTLSAPPKIVRAMVTKYGMSDTSWSDHVRCGQQQSVPRQGDGSCLRTIPRRPLPRLTRRLSPSSATRIDKTKKDLSEHI